MSITLKDIAESEKICEAMTEGPWRVCPDEKEEHSPLVCLNNDNHCGLCASGEAGYWAMTHEDAEGIAHARTRLPAMNKLVREMISMLKGIDIVISTNPDCEQLNMKTWRTFINVRRLVERMDGEPSP